MTDIIESNDTEILLDDGTVLDIPSEEEVQKMEADMKARKLSSPEGVPLYK